MFVRSAQSKKKFPCQLADYYSSSKVELFNLWLDAKGDWQETKLAVERKMEAKNTSKQGWKAVQGKELRGKYDETKFTKLITSRRDAGLFYEDPDFPGDVDETCLAPGVCKLGVSLGVRYVQENQSLG